MKGASRLANGRPSVSTWGCADGCGDGIELGKVDMRREQQTGARSSDGGRRGVVVHDGRVMMVAGVSYCDLYSAL